MTKPWDRQMVVAKMIGHAELMVRLERETIHAVEAHSGIFRPEILDGSMDANLAGSKIAMETLAESGRIGELQLRDMLRLMLLGQREYEQRAAAIRSDPGKPGLAWVLPGAIAA